MYQIVYHALLRNPGKPMIRIGVPDGIRTRVIAVKTRMATKGGFSKGWKGFVDHKWSKI